MERPARQFMMQVPFTFAWLKSKIGDWAGKVMADYGVVLKTRGRGGRFDTERGHFMRTSRHHSGIRLWAHPVDDEVRASEWDAAKNHIWSVVKDLLTGADLDDTSFDEGDAEVVEDSEQPPAAADEAAAQSDSEDEVVLVGLTKQRDSSRRGFIADQATGGGLTPRSSKDSDDKVKQEKVGEMKDDTVKRDDAPSQSAREAAKVTQKVLYHIDLEPSSDEEEAPAAAASGGSAAAAASGGSAPP